MREIHGLGCSSRSSGDNRLATGLRLKQDHAKPFDVLTNLPIGKHEQVTLLIAASHSLVAQLSQELNMAFNFVLYCQSFEEAQFVAIAHDGINYVRNRLLDPFQGHD